METTTGPDGLPVAFHDLPADKFPLTISAYAPDGSLKWEIENIQPYTAIKIPGTGPGSVARVVVSYADGTQEVEGDPQV
jgi:hypothetical protein